MATQAPVDWLAEIYSKRQELERRLKCLHDKLEEHKPIARAPSARPEGEFRYLELPVMLDNCLRDLGGPVSTTDLTNLLVAGRELDKRSWVLTNRNVSRLLNSRVRMGLVRKLGRVKGGNRAILWEWLG